MPPPTSSPAADRPARKLARILLVTGAAAGLLWGWRELLFLTDDAFIAFRYVRNLVEGRGLVWNPDPFPPVEGYTSFLWVVLLAAIWLLFGAPPDVSANLLSLLCGAGSLLLAADMLRRMDLPAALRQHRGWLLALLLLGILSNRTFLTWLSSGLETALFNLLVLAWLRAVLLPSPRQALAVSGTAALMALTRPDGLLYAALSLPLLSRKPAAMVPLLLIPAHLLWRRGMYGAWLPNTWLAKVSDPWPEAGWRYLASFVVEYGVWVWILLTLTFFLSPHRRALLRPGALLALAALGGHVGYYVLRVGGDHFEYRVLSHLVPPLYLSAAWMAARLLPARPAVVGAVMASFVLASWPVAWGHHALTRGRTSLAETENLTVPLAPHFPPPLRGIVAQWDGWQAWLIAHFVCKRRQEHQAFLEEVVHLLPDPEVGAQLRWEERRAVWWSRSVGYAGWALPEVAVIDALGLNDPVVARGPTRAQQGLPRRMAHDRQPPPGFMDCFRFNLQISDQQPRLIPGVPAMTDEEIRACYERFSPARVNTGS